MAGNHRKKYYTGFVSPAREVGSMTAINGRGWSVAFENQKNPHPDISGKQLIIYSKTWVTAQKALNLIKASLQLIHGQQSPFSSDLLAWNESEPELDLLTDLLRSNFMSTTKIPKACEVAAKSSKESKFVYAISKYYFSLSLFSIATVDLAPNSVSQYRLSKLPDDHVLYAYSIITAYSVLEDLGLEIRSNDSKPSRIDGKWNPVVKTDLEKRLTNSNIDTNRPILWTIRGTKRKTEFLRPIPIIAKKPWASGQVRDSEINLIDAIAFSSWLRSKVASHKSREIARSLSPYDVVNVQSLSRRMILESLGFWT